MVTKIRNPAALNAARIVWWFRWDFLQGEAAMQGPKSSGKHSTSKMFRRKLQKRLMHTKQQLLDFQVRHQATAARLPGTSPSNSCSTFRYVTKQQLLDFQVRD